MTQTVESLAYHRNGIGGLGFYAGIIKEDGRDMLVVRFPDADDKAGAILCAAFDIAKLGERNIKFGQNSWRGDHYAGVMDVAISKHRAELDAKYGT